MACIPNLMLATVQLLLEKMSVDAIPCFSYLVQAPLEGNLLVLLPLQLRSMGNPVSP
jgi:hypothetical protein